MPLFAGRQKATDAMFALVEKEEAMKEVYARIGQEPPPPPAEEVYDPRTLYEVSLSRCSQLPAPSLSPC